MLCWHTLSVCSSGNSTYQFPFSMFPSENYISPAYLFTFFRLRWLIIVWKSAQKCVGVVLLYSFLQEKSFIFKIAKTAFNRCLDILTSGWPLHDLGPQQCMSAILTKFGGHMSFLSKITSGWPGLNACVIFDPTNALTFRSGIPLRRICSNRHF